MKRKSDIYPEPDFPFSFLAPESYLWRKVRLADVGYAGEYDDSVVVLSLNRVRGVSMSPDDES